MIAPLANDPVVVRAMERVRSERIRLALKERRIFRTSEMFVYAVRGSQGNLYRTSLVVNSDGVHVQCNCTAGESDKFCKHAAAVLKTEGFI